MSRSEPKTPDHAIEASHEPEKEDLELPFTALAVCMGALTAPSGHAERRPYVAKKRGEREVELSIPASAEGGHHRYRVTFPDRVALPAARISE
ncbi:MAG TPA: hypothetical protein VKU00_18395 [Chthonomonadaceae bacterium]|nr:hypothetical protein [Chthonomonadaceae bacterium]